MKAWTWEQMVRMGYIGKDGYTWYQSNNDDYFFLYKVIDNKYSYLLEYTQEEFENAFGKEYNIVDVMKFTGELKERWDNFFPGMLERAVKAYNEDKSEDLHEWDEMGDDLIE